MLRGVLALRQCAGVGLGGEFVAEACLVLVLSHGEAPSYDEAQYRIRLQRLTIQFDRRRGDTALLS